MIQDLVRKIHTKNVYFYWDADDELPFTIGDCVVTFCAWLDNEELPSLKSTHRCAIPAKLLAKFQAQKADERKNIEFVTLSDSYQRNERMTESRLQKLLGF